MAVQNLVATAAICLCLLLGGASAVALEPAADFYVNDFAAVLSAETTAEILRCSTALAADTGARIAVLTVKTLNGQTPHDFVNTAAWGMGNNSLLILLAPAEGAVWVEIGAGLGGAFSGDTIRGYINTYAMDAYNNRDYDGGTIELYRALLSRVMVEYGLGALPGYESPAQIQRINKALLAAIIVLAIILLGLNGRSRRRKKCGGSPYAGFNSRYRGGASLSRGGRAGQRRFP